MNYPAIDQVLRAIFDLNHGLSERVAVELYVYSVANRVDAEEVKRELRSAFDDSTLSWKKMLSNESYEVYDFDSEEAAREYALKILWRPLLEAGLV